MAWWRSLNQLRADFAASGINLGRPGSPSVKSCRGKIRHRTRADAARHLRNLMFDDAVYRRCHRKVGALQIYRCKGCGFFHVGHDSLKASA